jgi:septal ring factor EnvC (AmiA/AmiB activator)
MTTQELSLAAAEDEVDHYKRALEGADRKLKKLRSHVKQTETDRVALGAALKAAEAELKAAKARDTEASAGSAEGQGSN